MEKKEKIKKGPFRRRRRNAEGKKDVRWMQILKREKYRERIKREKMERNESWEKRLKKRSERLWKTIKRKKDQWKRKTESEEEK